VTLATLPNGPGKHAAGALGVCLFLLALAALDGLTRGAVRLPALVPPFGASVVIVFFTPDSPFGRAWNVIVGQVVSALAATCVLWLLPDGPQGLLAALAVCGAGVSMLLTRSFHPPGGATALLAVVAQERLGFAMLLCPMLLGAVLLVASRRVVDGALAWAAARSLRRARVAGVATKRR
jgi:CBS domain-containing membrane protein